ncbi:MAG: glycosyltransferase [Bacteroidia bacterium]
MNIAYLSTFYPYRGGIVQFNTALYKALQKEHKVNAYTFTRQYPDLLFPGKTQYVTENDTSDKIETFRTLDTINPFSYYTTAQKIKKMQPDILLMKYWMPFFAPSLGTVSKMLRKKTKIISVLDNVISHEKRIGDRALTKYFLNQNHGFVVMSSQVKNDLLSFLPNANYVFHPHPLYDNFGEKISKEAACDYLKLDKNEKHILFFGFIRKYKGLDTLLETLADERLKQLNVKLIIAGEYYEDKSFYEELIQKYNLQDRLILKTEYIPSEDVKQYFCAADIVVQPYKTATQSGVTQIAYQFERPMLVTDVGGLSEIVPHNKVGYVTDSAPTAIADALLDFYNNKREQEFSANAAIEKKRFQWDSMAKAVIELSKK